MTRFSYHMHPLPRQRHLNNLWCFLNISDQCTKSATFVYNINVVLILKYPFLKMNIALCILDVYKKLASRRWLLAQVD
jgi:hypothetical protein